MLAKIVYSFNYYYFGFPPKFWFLESKLFEKHQILLGPDKKRGMQQDAARGAEYVQTPKLCSKVIVEGVGKCQHQGDFPSLSTFTQPIYLYI